MLVCARARVCVCASLHACVCFDACVSAAEHGLLRHTLGDDFHLGMEHVNAVLLQVDAALDVKTIDPCVMLKPKTTVSC